MTGFLIQAQAQKLTTKQVPSAVTMAFSKMHSSVQEVDWSKYGYNYKAMYKVNQTNMFVAFDDSGKTVDTGVEIAASALPFAIKEYINKNYKDDKVKKASKNTDPAGIVTYQAETKETVLTFDSQGSFIKAVKN